MTMGRNKAWGAVVAGLVLVLMACAPAQAREKVGTVVKTQGEVSAAFEGKTRRLAPGAELFKGDTLLTGGKDSRVQARLEDQSDLTLGGNGAMTLDDLVVGPPGTTREVMSLLNGAFLLVASPTPGAVIRTPVATLGIRGTQFWGGPLDGALDVFLLEGKVEVRNADGSVLLDAPGQGTVLKASGAPGGVQMWGPEKVARATSTISFAP